VMLSINLEKRAPSLGHAISGGDRHGRVKESHADQGEIEKLRRHSSPIAGGSNKSCCRALDRVEESYSGNSHAVVGALM